MTPAIVALCFFGYPSRPWLQHACRTHATAAEINRPAASGCFPIAKTPGSTPESTANWRGSRQVRALLEPDISLKAGANRNCALRFPEPFVEQPNDGIQHIGHDGAL